MAVMSDGSRLVEVRARKRHGEVVFTYRLEKDGRVSSVNHTLKSGGSARERSAALAAAAETVRMGGDPVDIRVEGVVE